MKSSSITGLAYAFIPQDTLDQKTAAVTAPLIADNIVSINNIYVFAGTMPASTTLQTYNDSAALLADFGSNLVTKILNFDIKYSYDEITRTRKMQKFPVNAETSPSLVDGTVTWCCLELSPIAISSPYRCMIFTDAIGGWDDASQSVLVSSTTVVKGENFTVKDINITLRDAMLVDLV